MEILPTVFERRSHLGPPAKGRPGPRDDDRNDDDKRNDDDIDDKRNDDDTVTLPRQPGPVLPAGHSQ